MSKKNLNKANVRQGNKRKGAAEKQAAIRATLENKARRMLSSLRRNPEDSQTTDALVDLVGRHPFLRNIKV